MTATPQDALAVDLFCGLGGWTDGLLAEGWDVIGFDLERHRYPKMIRPDDEAAQKCPVGGSPRNAEGKSIFKDRPCHLRDTMKNATAVEGEWIEYPAQLVLQDVRTLHGSQFRNADLIVASPPCQEFSYMAMPWTKAKDKQARIMADPAEQKRLTELFDACFRIQLEACEAAGRHIPMVVENVRGAQKWVGRARWNFGSFYLWGDVPALMPIVKCANKLADNNGVKVAGSWSGSDKPGYVAKAFNGTAAEHIKQGGDWFNASQPSISRMCGSKSSKRKAASALIAKIPLVLARHIAATYKPKREAA